ncbi:MAG: glycosyltransferase family 4 protein, partial [Sulfolobus sp.]|nr:glycosyltransferase family 4 protein [Sulfolobus sp.]
NAFDEILLKYSTLDKEDYAVFFARLIPEKGLFEIPKIWSKVREKLPNARLVVLGRFLNEKYKRRFLSLINGLGIEYKGFVSREELLKTVAKAKVVLNPTHFDAFSLTTLESLALKTPVVSYDIPAIKEIFGNQKAIKLVREFDVEGMAEKTVEVLREKDYSDWFDEEYEEFINLHKSWEKVADAEYNALKEFLDTAK